jgi:hypothetical protein
MSTNNSMFNSPYCPANKDSKYAMPGFEPAGCDSCIKESLEQEKVPRCFLCKFELAGPLVADDDFSLATFVRKFSEWRRKDKNGSMSNVVV